MTPQQSNSPDTLFTAHSVPLEEGDAGTAQTISLITQAIDEGKRDPNIRAAAGTIARNEPTNDVDRQAHAIYDWVKASTRFISSGVGVEVIQDPWYTLQNGFGDCDDFSVLICSLLGSIGIPTRLITVATDPDTANFSHIYPEYLSGDGSTWTALRLCPRGARFGRAAEPGTYHRMRVWYLDPATYEDVDTSAQSQFPGGLSGMLGLQGGFTGLADGDSVDLTDPGLSVWGDASGNPIDTDLDFATGATATTAAIPASWTPSQIVAAITAGGNSAAAVIRSLNTNGLPANLAAAGYRLGASGQLIGPNGQVYGASGALSLTGLTSSPVIWAVLGFGVAAVVAGRK